MTYFQQCVSERAASIAALNAAIDAALSCADATARALVAQARAHLECAHASEEWGRPDRERAAQSVNLWRRQFLRRLDEPLRNLVGFLTGEAECFFVGCPLPAPWEGRPAGETVTASTLSSPVNYRMACGCWLLDPGCQHWRVYSMY